jgi:hypothetical protein
MRHSILSLFLWSLIQTTSIGLSEARAQPPEKNASQVVEILSFKVGSDYYQMLDGRSAVIPADSSEYPRTEGERIQRQQNSRRSSSQRSEDLKARGRQSSRIHVISDATFVKAEVKNTGAKQIRLIDWDFAFPRLVNNQLALRYDVSTKIDIKPGAKKALKQQLPAGASKCKVIHLTAEDLNAEKGRVFDSVCGEGVHDGSYLKQETVSIKRIEYADGSIWVKP